MIVALNYRRLSPHVPLIAVGFGLMAFLHVVFSVISMVLVNMMMRHSVSGLTTASYGTLMTVSGVVSMSLNLGAWALILTGLSLTLRDLQSRLSAHANVNQNAASTNYAPLRDASEVYHQQLENRPQYHPQPAYMPSQEGSQPAAFTSPSAPSTAHNAPSAASEGTTAPPVRIAAVEPPEQAVTLGSPRP